MCHLAGRVDTSCTSGKRAWQGSFPQHTVITTSTPDLEAIMHTMTAVQAEQQLTDLAEQFAH
jgi:hypothetical protein